MSRKRKTSGGNPAKRPAAAAPATPSSPAGVMSGLTYSTAERVLEGLRLLDKLAADYPDLPHLHDTRVAYETASLALIEALDAMHDRTPYRIAIQEGTTP